MLKERKPSNAATIKAMKPEDKYLSDIEENEGLRVSCNKSGTKSFFYRYKSPITNKLCQIKIGGFPSTSLAEARVKLQELKVIRTDGRCPTSEQKKAKKDKAIIEEKLSSRMTVADVIELYLSQYIEDRTVNGKVIAGARKKKGQSETRRTLYCDAVKELGDRYAEDVTRKNIVNMIMGIVERGSNVQAGNVLRELTAAYEYSIGIEKFPDEFVNPALLAKNSLRQAKIRLTSKKGQRVLSDNELENY